jgi:hypothetical protein
MLLLQRREQGREDRILLRCKHPPLYPLVQYILKDLNA